ncbi:limbin [Discoglossus pictus]
METCRSVGFAELLSVQNIFTPMLFLTLHHFSISYAINPLIADLHTAPLFSENAYIRSNTGRRRSRSPYTKSLGRDEDHFTQGLDQSQWQLKKGNGPVQPEVQRRRSETRGEDPNVYLTSSASSISNPSVFVPSWVKRNFRRETRTEAFKQQQDTSRISWNGIVFQKCATVNNQEDPQTASVHLLVNSTDVSSSAMILSNLIVLDNITGLVVGDISGNSTGAVNGIQTYSKESLKAGEYFLVTYTASIDTKVATDGLELSLPVQLTFHNSSQVSSAPTSLLAPFTITAKENLKVVPNHGLHGAGFVIAFIVSFILTGAVVFLLYYTKKIKGRFLENTPKVKREQKLEPSEINFLDNVSEDIIVTDRMIDILAFEESDNMLQALEDSEITNMTHADSYLEVCRMHICKDVTGIYLRNLPDTLNLPPPEVKRLNNALSEQWISLEKRMQEEHQRKMVALTAECNLDTRKQMDIQLLREKAANEEAEEVMKQTEGKSFSEYKVLLDKLHDLEQAEMKRLLLFKQEEECARSLRQLTVSHRTELHNIFFDQIQESVSRGKIKPDVQRPLIENYRKVQEEAEDLMDFLQGNKKYHMSRRVANRKNVIYSIQLCDSKCRCLLNSAATQIGNLINKTERAGHLTESQTQLLLERAQSEVLRVKQKLENVLKVEKRKLHQKLTTKRKRQIIQKLKEQRKELSAFQEDCKSTKEVNHYLESWKKLFSEQSQELEELFEKHDNDTVQELKNLQCNQTGKAIEDLRHIQTALIMQEMLKLGVPKLHLQQVAEEHKRETALLGQQLETEETDKTADSRASLESAWRKLDEEFKLGVKEQKSLRHWEQQLFSKILLLPLSVSEKDIHKISQAFQGGFSQMDIPLALPKIQGRMLLHTYHTKWRKDELLKVDRNLLEFEKKTHAKTKNHPQEKNTEILKKSAEDKILIYEAQIPDDKIKQARGELLIQRVHRLKATEYKLGEYVASLQFQVINNKSKALEIHGAVLHLQTLLLEEMCRSRIATKSEYEQLLETQSQEIWEIDRSLESWTGKEMVNDELWDDHKAADMNNGSEDLDMPLSATLRMALNRRRHLTNLCKERLQKEELEYAVMEDQVEKAQMDSFIRLYNQDIRLAAYLTKRIMLPEGLLRRVLNLLLPSSLETEILSILYSVSHKYSESVTETDNTESEADSWGKRKHQELWTLIEKRLQEGLINQEQEKSTISGRKKRSILKKKRLRSVKRVSFSHTESFSKLLQAGGRAEQFGSAEAIHLPETGEKLFIFQAPSESSTSSARQKKKRNFLNFKKSIAADV